jgi:hypothetical protein
MIPQKQKIQYIVIIDGTTLETVKIWVEAQGTIEHKRKSQAKRPKATS